MGAHIICGADICAPSAAGGFRVLRETRSIVFCDLAVGEIACPDGGVGGCGEEEWGETGGK